MSEPIGIRIDSGIAHVLLNRPEKKNALDGDMFEGLRQAAIDLAADPSFRVVVLSGAGDSFCSGIDLSNFGAMASGEQAVEFRLATETSDTPLEAAFDLARTIAERSPDAIRAAKKLLNTSGLVPLADGLANERVASSALMGTKNQVEAVMSKLEKRAAHFEDPSVLT